MPSSMPQLRPIIGVGMSFFVLVIFLVLALGLRKKSKAARVVAINPIIICPALIFAIIRIVSVKGRIIILAVSITTRKGRNPFGAPDGAK
jgi:predicted branched-subunit amino acid permease